MKKNTRKRTKRAKGGDLLYSFRWRRLEPVMAVVPLDTGDMYLGSTQYRDASELLLIAAKVDEIGEPSPDFGEPGLGSIVFRIANWPSRTNAVLAGMARTAEGGVILAVESAGILGFASLTPAGALNPAFGNGGSIVHDFTNPSQGEALATAEDFGPRTSTLSGGFIPAPGGGFYAIWDSVQGGLTKIRADGQLDAGFGNGGSVTVAHPAATQTIPSGVLAWGDAHLAVFGMIRASDGSRFGFVARFHSDGRLDMNFGREGFADIAPGDAGNQLLDLAAGAVGADGNIFLSGRADVNGVANGLLCVLSTTKEAPSCRSMGVSQPNSGW